MLTKSGWAVLIGAGVMLVAGRMLGAFELYLLGAGVAALVLVATLAVNLTRLQVGLSRAVIPPRVHAGGTARVELRLANHATRKTPTLRLYDAVTGTRGANLLFGPLGHNEQARAAYQLPTDKRGTLGIGPLEIVVADPFGIAESRTTAVGEAQLIVYPHLDDVLALDHASSHDPQATSRHPNALGRVGDDFYALRPYVVGDDLRRVHWPSVARTGELMIRQHELPWQERTTVLLDVSAAAHTDATFERAVSAAASILVAAHGRGDQIRLASSDGNDSGFGLSRAHLDALLHHLALIQPDPTASLVAGADDLARTDTGGSLVLVAAAVNPGDATHLGGLRRRFGHVVMVVFDDPDLNPAGAGSATGVSGAAVLGMPRQVRCGPDEVFAAVWNRSGVAGAAQRKAAASNTAGAANLAPAGPGPVAGGFR